MDPLFMEKKYLVAVGRASIIKREDNLLAMSLVTMSLILVTSRASIMELKRSEDNSLLAIPLATMSLIPLLISFLLLAVPWLLLVAIRGSGKSRGRQLPPGPWGLPFIGHLHLLSQRPYRDMHRLSLTYGPVMHLRMGSIPTIVVSSPAAARELFKSHDLAISDRPHWLSGDLLNYHSSTVANAPYGPYWRAMRRLFNSEYFAAHKVDSFASVRREEVHRLIADLKGGAAADVSAKISYFALEVACRTVLGGEGLPGVGREEMRELRWLIRDGSTLLSALNFGDFIPFIERFDLQGLRRKMLSTRRGMKPFLTKIEERMEAGPGEGRPNALIDVLLAYKKERPDGDDFKFNRNHIKVLLLEVIATPVETVLSTAEWALVELLRHPEIMEQAKEEMANVVGLDRVVDESDIANLPFLEMVLKESMRLHPPLPHLIPRKAREDFTLQGFYVPRGSHVFVNAWAMARDPTVWPEPERFCPERFLHSKVDVKGHDFEFIPFGSGRRICSGMHSGLTLSRLLLAQLVHCFDWELPDRVSPDELNMEESYNTAATRADPLLAIPIYRLHCEV